jgi:hypothetical protein
VAFKRERNTINLKPLSSIKDSKSPLRESDGESLAAGNNLALRQCVRAITAQRSDPHRLIHKWSCWQLNAWTLQGRTHNAFIHTRLPGLLLFPCSNGRTNWFGIVRLTTYIYPKQIVSHRHKALRTQFPKLWTMYFVILRKSKCIFWCASYYNTHYCATGTVTRWEGDSRLTLPRGVI